MKFVFNPFTGKFDAINPPAVSYSGVPFEIGAAETHVTPAGKQEHFAAPLANHGLSQVKGMRIFK